MEGAMNNSYNKVFISYASEDLSYAARLFDFLKSNNFDPWLDKKCLLPGQDWNSTINFQLRIADFVILLLSKTSVEKRGYVQREFNLAVDYCKEKLDTDIYIIPIKIDSCDVPDKLIKFQWAEYSSPDIFDNILNSLRFQQKRIFDSKQKTQDAIGAVIDELCESGCYGEKAPFQRYEFSIPQFKNTNNVSLLELNTMFLNSSLQLKISARDAYYQYLKDVSPYELAFLSDSIDNLKTTISFQNETFISYTTFYSNYGAGAMHGFYGTAGNNYFLHPLMSFKFESLFENYYEARFTLRDIINKLLDEKYSAEERRIMMGDSNDSAIQISEEPAFYENYYFKHSSIVYIFGCMLIAPRSFGEIECDIQFSELLSAFPKEIKLKEFINSLNSHETS